MNEFDIKLVRSGNVSTEDKVKVFSLRIPKELYKQVDKKSKKNRRSVNSEILILLERFVDSEEILVPGAKYIEIIGRAREKKEQTP